MMCNVVSLQVIWYTSYNLNSTYLHTVCIISYLNWQANQTQKKVSKGQTGQENVGWTFHCSVAKDGNDDEQVSDKSHK